LGKWEVFIECPYKPVGKRWRITAPFVETHETVKVFSMIIDAKNAEEAEKRLVGKTVECPYPIKGKFHNFTVQPENIKAVRPWPPPPPSKKEREAKLMEKRPPAAKEAPTELVAAKRFPDNTIAISIRRGPEQMNILYSKSEVETFDKLMKTAKAAGQDTLENAILAYMLAVTGGTASTVTGFLTASGFKTDRTSVGEALSRLVREGYLYKYRAEIPFVREPLSPYSKPVRRYTSEILGEAVYGIPHTTRINILERLKLEPSLAWWRPELYKLPPPLEAVRRKPEYEWVTITKPLPKIRSAEDLKWYGPYTPPATVKLPLALAYFLTSQGYAEWLNPKKETVKQAEEIFKFQPIEKIKRQATLTEF
jgi:hypothetical protein